MPDKRIASPALEYDVLMNIPLPGGWAYHSYRSSAGVTLSCEYKIHTPFLYRRRSEWWRPVHDVMASIKHRAQMIGYMAAAPIYFSWTFSKGNPSPHLLVIGVTAHILT
jgi:hypothetical protein